jgi:hypothetical protein
VASSSDLDRIHQSLALTSLDRHFDTELVFSAQMVDRGMQVVGLLAGLHARPSLGDRLRQAGVEHIAKTVEELDSIIERLSH